MSWRRPGPVSGLGLGLAGGLLLLALASIGALISAAGSGYGTPSHTTRSSIKENPDVRAAVPLARVNVS